MTSLLGLNNNISYFTIPLALALALVPRFYSGLAGPGKKLFDRQNPREFSETLKKADLDEKLRGRLLRAEACSANGFEALPLYAAAVTAANSAGISTPVMNFLSISWLSSRVLYTYVYVWHQERETLAQDQAPLRFKVWAVGAVIYKGNQYAMLSRSTGKKFDDYDYLMHLHYPPQTPRSQRQRDGMACGHNECERRRVIGGW
ncbi:hypothetical protein CGCF415_v014378 [Colletotrichum fructicola]|uniref:Uncharacterized protein n=1 Tax=Colletotrichum fructicola (strain Nara gc5) TaxID=1213859 RepID=A0A7J6JAY6_COLFN|nr:hypothetical protein CFRS1_v014308 [Colletotrichum fructicola]KAF4486296.1 hypothetical protein CGGC5_v004860 [Colletotrichum fructicola Nara gc5]KAF4888718.1 hypothetical protein CGCF415_v014378 [Colletotrichum fructicola]KAF4893762.1 hypothetical protein CGCFRS4_v006882 [Colletotrichum fructicola]KAF4932236.1 hypothetical protein CGCF245_v010817 [Colletotrichum fructicola]